jgi:hypothetical protein
MGKITGFLEFDRKVESYAPVQERVKNFKESCWAASKAKALNS